MGDENKELILVRGSSDGVSAGGTMTLTGDLIQAGQTKFVIPKGMTLKAWARELSGSPGIVAIVVNWNFANDGTTFRTLFTDNLVASSVAGVMDFEFASRPRVFRSMAGTEAVQLTWLGGNTGGTNSTVAFNLELSQD